jgi:hypothetical protein
MSYPEGITGDRAMDLDLDRVRYFAAVADH